MRHSAMASVDTGYIDQLLERYLALLDEYTTLRGSLSRVQSSVYQHLARANFSAERGFRFGADHYDERMQASRVVTIHHQDDGDFTTPRFRVIRVTDDTDVEAESKSPSSATSNGAGSPPDQAQAQEEGESEIKTKPKIRKGGDPLRWYGILAPMPLRQAQSEAIKAVEDIIPRLATVNAEMESLEIAVRRARKKRAKAEAASSAERDVETATL